MVYVARRPATTAWAQISPNFAGSMVIVGDQKLVAAEAASIPLVSARS